VNTPKFTAVYIRVSSPDQKYHSQQHEIKDHCRVRGWKNAAVYRETESGAKTSRPELERLMADLRGGRIARVVCFKLDRLGRSLTHLALILDEMNRLQVPLVCTSQGIDTSDDNPAGKLQLGMLMAVAEFERSLIRERVHSGLRAARARGVRLGRPATLRDRIDDVRKLKKSGLGIRAIARQLNMPPSSVCKVLSLHTSGRKGRTAGVSRSEPAKSSDGLFVPNGDIPLTDARSRVLRARGIRRRIRLILRAVCYRRWGISCRIFSDIKSLGRRTSPDTARTPARTAKDGARTARTARTLPCQAAEADVARGRFHQPRTHSRRYPCNREEPRCSG